MNTFNHIIAIFAEPDQVIGLDGFAMVLMAYFLLSWLVCVVAAFLKVKEVQYYVGLIAMGLTILMALVLGGLCRNLLPDLASTLSPGGLFLFGAVAGIMVCSAPVLQFFWNISYSRALACVVCGILVLAASVVLVQILADTNEPLQAKFSVPMFLKDGAGLLK